MSSLSPPPSPPAQSFSSSLRLRRNTSPGDSSASTPPRLACPRPETTTKRRSVFRAGSVASPLAEISMRSKSVRSLAPEMNGTNHRSRRDGEPGLRGVEGSGGAWDRPRRTPRFRAPQADETARRGFGHRDGLQKNVLSVLDLEGFHELWKRQGETLGFGPQGEMRSEGVFDGHGSSLRKRGTEQFIGQQ